MLTQVYGATSVGHNELTFVHLHWGNQIVDWPSASEETLKNIGKLMASNKSNKIEGFSKSRQKNIVRVLFWTPCNTPVTASYVTSFRVQCLAHVFAFSLQWRHNERGSVSNHQRLHCLLNCRFRRRSKKTSKLRVTGLCAGNSPVTGEFPAQKASNAENVSIWWRNHVCCNTLCSAVLYGTALRRDNKQIQRRISHIFTNMKKYIHKWRVR